MLRVLMQPDITGVAIVCRSLAVSKTAFRAIVTLRARRLPLIEHDIDETVLEYSRLDTATLIEPCVSSR